MVRTHRPGANITLMNTLSSRFKDDKGHFKEYLSLIYKDVDTGIKYKEEILDPEYTFYVSNPDNRVRYNRLFIGKDDCQPVTVVHREIEKSIANIVGEKQFYFDNVASGNNRENQRLHMHPDIFNSDMHLEDYYRFEFDKKYKNQSCSITKSFLDIEADTINMMGDFPQMGECPVNAVTLILPYLNRVYTFLLRTKSNPLIKDFEKEVMSMNFFDELKAFVVEKVGGPDRAKKFGIDKFEYSFMFYEEDEEINLIADVFKAINTYRPDFCLAWNMAFDIPYLIERIRVLGYEPTDIICDKDFVYKFCSYYIDERNKNALAERGDFANISSYTTYLDQMIQFASRRKAKISSFVGFSLDYIGGIIAKVNKYDYKDITTSIAELPYKNYKVFVLYNIMDVIVQVAIEAIAGDLDYVFNKALINNTRYSKVHRQTVYLTNRGVKNFYKDGLIMGNNCNRFNPKPDTKFPGAFVADMTKINDYSRLRIAGIPIRVFDSVIDEDYAALYPSINEMVA